MKLLLSVLAVIIGIILWCSLGAFEKPFIPCIIGLLLIFGGGMVILVDTFNNK